MQVLDELANHPNAIIAKTAVTEKARFAEIVKAERAREQGESRQRDERFE